MNRKSDPVLHAGRPFLSPNFYTGMFWLVAVWWVVIGVAILRISSTFWLSAIIYGGGFGALFAGAIWAYRKGGTHGWRLVAVLPLPVLCAAMMLICFVVAAFSAESDLQASRFAAAPPLLVRARQVMRALEAQATKDGGHFPLALPRTAISLPPARHAPPCSVAYRGGGTMMLDHWSSHIVFFLQPSLWHGWHVVGYADGRVTIAYSPALGRRPGH